MSNIGFQSNFIDSGYTINSNFEGRSWVDQSGKVISNVLTPVPGVDIYNTTQQVGVYMINGTFNNSNVYYPVFCSANDIRNVGIPYDNDDAYLVYPGFGFTLYTGTNNSGSYSVNCINTSNAPVIFANYVKDGGWLSVGSLILLGPNGTTGLYDVNSTKSIQIYFRGSEIKIKNIS